jgi:hypothetical protein
MELLLRFEPVTDGAVRFATMAKMFRVGALGNLPMGEWLRGERLPPEGTRATGSAWWACCLCR